MDLRPLRGRVLAGCSGRGGSADNDERTTRALTMADEPAPPETPDAEEPPAAPLAWSQLWQVPALLLGLGLFAVGLWAVRPVNEVADLDAVLDDADALLVAAGGDDLLEAGEKLELAFDGFAEAEATDAQRGRYWQYAGDKVYLSNARGGVRGAIDRPEGAVDPGEINHANLLESYTKAEKLGRVLDARSQRWRALTLVDLGRTEEALAAVEAMGPDAGRERLSVLREMIDRRSAAAGSPAERAEDPVLAGLLERYRETVATLRDPADRLSGQRWLAAASARRLLAAGAYARAVDFLSREVMQLRSLASANGLPADEADPELTLLLGDAHRGLGDAGMAGRLYRQAQRALPAQAPLAGDALLGLAALAESAAEAAGSADPPADAAEPLAEAAGLYAQVMAGFPGDRRELEARLGVARVATHRDPPAEALAAWRSAVAALSGQTDADDARRDAAARGLDAATDLALEQGRHADALDLLEATTPLFGRGVPASLLLRQARTREKLAEQRMADGDAASGPARGQAFRDAAAGFAAAGASFLQHARRLERIDPEASALSLWQSARAFDRAERWAEAIEGYNEYLAAAPDGATLQEARHQLGLAYLASGQAQAALERLEALIAESPTSRWSFASLVPLARAQLATGAEDAAQVTLMRALEDNPAITPSSPVYRDALVMLGRTLCLRAREEPSLYPDAIARLEEADQRFGEGEQGPEIRYHLADALRRSIATLGEAADAGEDVTAAERLALEAERSRRLRRAADLFADVRHALEARDDATLTPLEALFRRNAWFYQPDCVYLAGDYGAAIPLYREASERWSGDPAALVAQVQIVNAHCELGEFAAAGVANRRALLLLNRMDDAAFESPDLPMDRRHWQDWLRWSSELDLFASAE